MDKKKKKQKRYDRIGIACGILLVVLAIFCIVAGNAAPVAGVKDSEIPENAVTLTGSADGRNGPVSLVRLLLFAVFIIVVLVLVFVVSSAFKTTF